MNERPAKKSSRWKSGARGALLCTLGLLWLPGAGGLREDEFQCEQAVAHLEECCPDFDRRAMSCSYSTGCGTTTLTTFSIPESRCIQETSCEAIVNDHMCERSLARDPETIDEDGDGSSIGSGSSISTGTVANEEVCP